MKPMGSNERARLPRTDYYFHSDLSRWRGFWGPFGDEGAWERKKFYDFTRQFLLESARERAKEMAVFGLVVLTAAWPVGYMVVTVVKLLLKGRPLDQ
jgi:CRISPR/Cas system endoribonuclease Cas6 (RAMP superfamily)